MAEQNDTEKYIKCLRCKCKYLNDDEHIKTDFGHNRLNERFKTCNNCREKYKKHHKKNKNVINVDLKYKFII